MGNPQRDHPGADMQGFVRELVDFVGLTDDDVALIRRTAPIVLQHERQITDALYGHFLKDGSPDPQRLERRKHSLARWLRETAEVAMTHDFVYYLLAVSLSHSHRQHGPGGKVPPQFMVGAMSLAQTAFAGLFQEALDAPDALDATVAWNKLLLVHLNVLLLGYFLPQPAK